MARFHERARRASDAPPATQPAKAAVGVIEYQQLLNTVQRQCEATLPQRERADLLGTLVAEHRRLQGENDRLWTVVRAALAHLRARCGASEAALDRALAALAGEATPAPNGLAAITGQWPGDETEAELLDALAGRKETP